MPWVLTSACHAGGAAAGGSWHVGSILVASGKSTVMGGCGESTVMGGSSRGLIGTKESRLWLPFRMFSWATAVALSSCGRWTYTIPDTTMLVSHRRGWWLLLWLFANRFRDTKVHTYVKLVGPLRGPIKFPHPPLRKIRRYRRDTRRGGMCIVNGHRLFCFTLDYCMFSLLCHFTIWWKIVKWHRRDWNTKDYCTVLCDTF